MESLTDNEIYTNQQVEKEVSKHAGDIASLLRTVRSQTKWYNVNKNSEQQ
jgi:hypothetical protein